MAVSGVNIYRADVVVGFDAPIARSNAQIAFERDPEFDTKRAVSETGIPMRVGHARFQFEAVANLAFDDTHFTVVNSPTRGFNVRFDLFPFPRGYTHSAVVGFDVDRTLAGHVIRPMPLIA